tara:strand:- start:369 stop:515 length:147 start_codon:yes stop_codon:yes gene_type:complete
LLILELSIYLTKRFDHIFVFKYNGIFLEADDFYNQMFLYFLELVVQFV